MNIWFKPCRCGITRSGSGFNHALYVSLALLAGERGAVISFVLLHLGCKISYIHWQDSLLPSHKSVLRPVFSFYYVWVCAKRKVRGVRGRDAVKQRYTTGRMGEQLNLISSSYFHLTLESFIVLFIPWTDDWFFQGSPGFILWQCDYRVVTCIIQRATECTM